VEAKRELAAIVQRYTGPMMCSLLDRRPQDRRQFHPLAHRAYDIEPVQQMVADINAPSLAAISISRSRTWP
jgi:hypothetical protein